MKKSIDTILQYAAVAAPPVKCEVTDFEGMVTISGKCDPSVRQYAFALAHAFTLHPASASVTMTTGGIVRTWERETGWKPTSSDDVVTGPDALLPAFSVTFGKDPGQTPCVFWPKAVLRSLFPPLTIRSVPYDNGVPLVDYTKLVAVQHTCDGGERVRWRTTADFLSFDGIRLLGSWGDYKMLVKTGFKFAHRGPDVPASPVGTGWSHPVDFFPMTEKMEAELYVAASKEGHGARIQSTPDWNTNGKFSLPWYQCLWSGLFPVQFSFLRAGHMKIWVATGRDVAANCGLYDGKGRRIQNEGTKHEDEADSFLDYSQGVRGSSAYVKVAEKGSDDFVPVPLRDRLRSDTHLGGPKDVPKYG